MAQGNLDQATLNQIHGNQISMLEKFGEVKSQVSGAVSDIRHIKDQVDRNTGQISEIRRTPAPVPTPSPTQPTDDLLTIMKKILPFIGYMIAGAAIAGASFIGYADKILK